MATATTKRAATAASKQRSDSVLTAEEKAAVKDYVQEKKRARAGKTDGQADLLAKVAALKGPERALAKRIHEIVTAAVPSLQPRTWYGMPAYDKDGKVLCFFQPASKFKTRYGTFGFSDQAKLDVGNMWPTSYAISKLTPADEKKLTALVKKAAR